jgi:hypothetical protein
MFTSGLLSAIFVTQALASGPADSVNDAKIRAAYDSLVRVEAVAPPGSVDTMIVLNVVAPPSGHLLTEFFHGHELWFRYLVVNGRGFRLPGLDDVAPGVSQAKPGHRTTALLRADFLRRLAGDSQFNALVVPAIAAHLRQSGTPVVARLGAPPRVIIRIDTAIKVAVRFFYPDLIV